MGKLNVRDDSKHFAQSLSDQIPDLFVKQVRFWFVRIMQMEMHMIRNINKNIFMALTGLGMAMAYCRMRRKRRAISFAGRSVLITGARGLALVIARLLADEGARLTLLARDEEELDRAREDLIIRVGEVMVISADVRQQVDVEQAVQQIIDRYGTLDVVINVAGVIQVGPLDHMTVEDFENALAVHAWGPLYTMLAAIPHMRRQGGGRIVNVSSIGGKVAVPHLIPYCTSKFALVGLSDGMRAELANDNIYVTTVSPGLMRTGSHMNALFKGRHEKEFTWFSVFDAFPLASTTALKAARQIVEACRYGDPSLVITIQARLAALANEIWPRLMATGMVLFNNYLLPSPAPAKEDGDRLQRGWESQSDLAPSVLTGPADQAVPDNNELPGRA